MKNYFNFNLTGKKFLPIWILFLVLYLFPYVGVMFAMNPVQPGGSPSMVVISSMFLLIVIAFVFTFYITKIIIENVSFKDKSIVFNGSFGKYIGTVLLGFFLTVITAGIYGAWFIRNVYRFFIDNSTYDSNALKFKGKGGKLFVILLLSIILPTILFTLVIAHSMSIHTDSALVVGFIHQSVLMLMLVPYFYLVYKWMVNVDYKEFHISWKTEFWSSCSKIGIQLLLSIITLGIYTPLAILRLYKYFAENTLAESNERTLTFGYDIDQLNDFLFIWGQMLLAMITLGIYYPWAFCKISSRVLKKTYLLEK